MRAATLRSGLATRVVCPANCLNVKSSEEHGV
jgi:hypothetical protein